MIKARSEVESKTNQIARELPFPRESGQPLRALSLVGTRHFVFGRVLVNAALQLLLEGLAQQGDLALACV